ncbi:MAG: hypothetical protein QGD89_01480 [Actinomycetota bacterium]|nr:hypothetical protein [Actinomycetota bacterium]
MVRTSDALSIGASAIFGAVTGWLLLGAPGGIAAAIISGGLAYVGARSDVRSGLVVTVLIGAMTGTLIGANVVKAICLPSICAPLEVAGGVISGTLSFIGVGLVAALVTRSFDEYNERLAAGLPPTTVGCEGGDAQDPDTPES